MGINLGDIATTPQTSSIKETVPTPTPVIPEGATPIDRGNGLMSLNLNKGISLDLTKSLPHLSKVKIGLGWDAVPGQKMDLDVFALALHDGKIKATSDVVYYAQRNTVSGVSLSEDNRTGEGEGDDETIVIDLNRVPADVSSVAIFVNIYEAASLSQNFGMVRNAYCRMVNDETNKEEAIFVLNESDAALYNAFHFVTLERNSTGWDFKTIAKGLNGDINSVASTFFQ